jgi:nucleoside-diphosphate-sugar epimerase
VKVKTWLENFFQTEKELLVNNYPGLTLSIFENHFIDLLKKNHYLPTLDQSIWSIENRKLMQWSKNWISGEPLAYQLGEGYFFSYPIRLNADCLVPRNETELILELAPLKQNMKVLDLCSGPGTIGLGCLLFSRLPLDVHFVDIDEKVIKWAKQNAFNLKNSYHPSSSTSFYVQDVREKLPINEECTFHPASPYAISKCGTDLVGRYYAEAFGINTQITRMFTHTGPRRGDVFAESSFAKQIAMIELGLIEPVVRVGNLNSLRTIADVRDAVRAYYLLVTKNPVHGAYYNIGGNKILKIGEILEYLIGISTKKGIKIEIDQSRLRPIDADLQVPDPSKFINHTGWQPEILFEKTMSDLLDYWRVEVSNRRDVRIVR